MHKNERRLRWAMTQQRLNELGDSKLWSIGAIIQYLIGEMLQLFVGRCVEGGREMDNFYRLLLAFSKKLNLSQYLHVSINIFEHENHSKKFINYLFNRSGVSHGNIIIILELEIEVIADRVGKWYSFKTSLTVCLSTSTFEYDSKE